PAPPAPAATGAIDKAGMDPKRKPGDDFYKYANGTWLANTEIPADRSSYGTGAIVTELTAKRTAALIQEAAQSAAPGTEARKVGDYYASFMDEAAIEAQGLSALQPQLGAIAKVKDRGALSTLLGSTLRADVDAINNTNFFTRNLFGLWVAQDLSDPSKYAPFLLQGGLGMPDREYYLSKEPRMAALRDKYLAHIAAVLGLAKVADPAGKAKRILALEVKIATGHAPRSDSGDVTKGNTHWATRELGTRAPGIDWTRFFAAAGLAKAPEVTVWQPRAVTALAALVGKEPIATWTEYLTFHAIDRLGPNLPKAFVDEHFAFYGTALSGTPQLRERWKRGVDATSDALGQAVGKLYVERYFPASEKQRLEEMVRNELAAFARRIDNLAWMAPATKAKAKAKVLVLKVGVGYPDRWTDYSSLQIIRGDALGNVLRAEQFALAKSLAHLGQPVDRGEWVMNPQLVNAVNLPAMNALNFPAAILQPPYFDPRRPIVMDYGAIGAVIGHEISHSFDDQGALFDATGKLENWWTQEDFAHFQASGQQLAKQYDGYRPFPDLAVNGQLTLSENLADVAGLSVAYDAYRLSYGGKEAPTVDGFTGDQQFFLGFAQSWRNKGREAAVRQRILTDGHAPAEYRADTVRNLDAWYTAFDVKPGEGLYLAPADRVHVW
ncbi:MAG: M13 family metallopeptidase, partial [Myxococcales bacterium]|nr:M13 family metallopeptidase [Myxococcales bacterium]